MLYTPVNEFNWEATNFADAFGSTTNSTLLTASGTAHVKGADASVMVGLAEDCYGMILCFFSGSTVTTIRRQMVDLLIDPAAGVGNAGASWTVLINNLFTGNPSVLVGKSGHKFYFPLFLKAGTAIGARTQDTVIDATVRLAIKVFGKPTHPELVKFGTSVQTMGADTATTAGITVVPGVSSVYGSYSATYGTLARDAWWWQLGYGLNDSSMSDGRQAWDIAHDTTAKILCAQGIESSAVSAEETVKEAFGHRLPIRCASAGSSVYVRALTTNSTADSGYSAVVYAVGE